MNKKSIKKRISDIKKFKTLPEVMDDRTYFPDDFNDCFFRRLPQSRQAALLPKAPGGAKLLNALPKAKRTAAHSPPPV
jgi:hypothetical protein